MDEDRDNSPPCMLSKCRKQCRCACNDRRCCSPRYYSPPSTCTVQYSRPCTCLQNVKLDYNIEPWPKNWREEFFKLRKMWSNHSKFSYSNLTDRNTSNGTIASKYCNSNFCWHERPYRTNSISVKCACCSSKNMRDFDTLPERMSDENIPKFYDLDCWQYNAQTSSSKCDCFNGNLGLPKNYITSRTPEKYIAHESRAPINPSYSKNHSRVYRDNFEPKVFCCPCCKNANKLPVLPEFDVEEYPVKEPKRIQVCCKKIPKERPQTSKRENGEHFPVREQQKIQHCYRKPTLSDRVYEDNRPTKDVSSQRNKFNDDFEDDRPITRSNRHIALPNMSQAQMRPKRCITPMQGKNMKNAIRKSY